MRTLVPIALAIVASPFLMAQSCVPIPPGGGGGGGGPQPIDAPPDEWTWVDFPGSHCGDGSATGIAVNPSPAANPSGLLIYMEGGGACWTEEDCSASVAGFGLALHMGGYDEDTWNGLWGSVYSATPVFRRSWLGDNPWRDAHMVFVPYCTGDVFGGDAVTTLTSEDGEDTGTFYFKGYDNVRQYLDRIAVTFPDVDRVWLVGSSAGAFGAALNWFQAAEKFGSGVRVDVLSDSGQPIEPADGLFDTWIDTWNLQTPSACSDCDQGMSRVIDYALNTRVAAGSRYGLIVFPRDATIADFFGITTDEHEARVNDLFARYFDNPSFPQTLRQRARYFALSNSFHTTLIAGYDTFHVSGETQLDDWLHQFVSDDPAWTNLYEGTPTAP